jgi:AcrR family transcriptional regulator
VYAREPGTGEHGVRASPEKKEEKERVRLSLLKATLSLSAAHGFASLGLREVAREANIAPTSFYRHFADMEELGQALLEEFAGPLLERLAAAADELDGAGSAAAAHVLTAAMAAVRDEPEVVRFILSEQAGAFPSFRAGLRRKLVRLAEALTPLFGGKAAVREAFAAVLVLLDAMNRRLELGDQADPAACAELEAELLTDLQRQFSLPSGASP